MVDAVDRVAHRWRLPWVSGPDLPAAAVEGTISTGHSLPSGRWSERPRFRRTVLSPLPAPTRDRQQAGPCMYRGDRAKAEQGRFYDDHNPVPL
jgi:hypothetical protein